MATYAIYFHPPTTVHNGPEPYRTLRLQGLAVKPSAPRPTLSEIDSALSHVGAEPNSKNVGTTPSNTASQQEKSPLFRLPAELRNKIYVELLCPDAISPKELSKRDNGRDLSVRWFNQTNTRTTLYPSILSTCKIIHEEAGALLYTRHTFHAHPSLLTSLPHLTSSTHPVFYSHLTSLITRWQISLRLDIDPRFTYAQATNAFSGTEYLEIRVWQAQFESCDYTILKLFLGVRGVGVAKVGGSVDRDLASMLEGVMMGKMGAEKTVEECGCDWEGTKEALCGRCYKRMAPDVLEKERDFWALEGR